jgi:hypothetical protein
MKSAEAVTAEFAERAAATGGQRRPQSADGSHMLSASNPADLCRRMGAVLTEARSMAACASAKTRGRRLREDNESEFLQAKVRRPLSAGISAVHRP